MLFQDNFGWYGTPALTDYWSFQPASVFAATANGQGVRRTANIVQPGDFYTCAFWYRITSLGSALDYRAAFGVFNTGAPGTHYAGIYNDDASTNVYQLSVNDGSTHNTATAALTLGTWYHLAYVRSGALHSFLVNGSLVGSATATPSPPWNYQALGYDGFSADAGSSWTTFREWTATLTSAELLAESRAARAVRRADLFTDTPLAANLLDRSGNGHHWTAVP